MPRARRCVCGSRWSRGLDALLFGRGDDTDYRDWLARHADCIPSAAVPAAT